MAEVSVLNTCDCYGPTAMWEILGKRKAMGVNPYKNYTLLTVFVLNNNNMMMIHTVLYPSIKDRRKALYKNKNRNNNDNNGS